jgi:hypothetical protein
MWKERMIERYNEDVAYLAERGLFPVIDKTIIKLDAVDDNSNDYKDKTGVHFMEEDTLILGDNDNNNVYLVFEKEDEIGVHSITGHMHVTGEHRYGLGSFIHKKRDIIPMPTHLRLIIVNNIVTNITNNFQSVNISSNTTSGGNFFERNYQRGGMYPLVDMRRHPEWVPGYRKHIEVKRVNICKSCKKRFIKGCCPGYRADNKTMQTMVIGWH